MTRSDAADDATLPCWRTLRGPNRYFADYGIVATVATRANDELDHWRDQVERLRGKLGWPSGPLVAERGPDALTLAIEAPADQLDVAGELSRIAWLNRRAADAGAADARALCERAAAQRNPALDALLAAARLRGLPVVLGARHLAIGHGAGSRCWSLAALPTVEAVGWAELHGMPTALLAAPDTTVALVAAMLRAQGWHSGECRGGRILIDGVSADGEPAPPQVLARRLLRQQAVEAAVVAVSAAWYADEGLPLRQASVVAIDGLRERDGGATESLHVLLRALDADGTLVLDADHPELIAAAASVDAMQAWYAADHQHPRLLAQRAAGGATCAVLGDRLLLCHAPRQWELGCLAVGSTRRWVDRPEAAAAALVAHALGVSPAAIRTVLARSAERSLPA